jgi:murein L,D-transpeptidase YafK
MRLFFGILIMLGILAGCASTGTTNKFRSYDGPEVTKIVINKSSRQMDLLSGTRVLKSYSVDLGFNPTGDKKIEGDGRTPEGVYRIDRRNPNSRYYLSIGISYPNANDVAEAKAMGKSPGGDIFIHGGPRLASNKGRPDWTAGCISVSDREIETIYAMVKNGTLIEILP